MKKSFSILLLLACTLSFSTAASGVTNEDCKVVYRDGALDLLEAVEDYNSKSLTKGQFSGEVTGIGTTVKAVRTACYFVEGPEIKSCVEEYKALYNDLRDRISLRAIMAGNQEKVKLPLGYKIKMMGKLTIRDGICSGL